MSSPNDMPKTSSGKKPIDKIVVCGCSFSLPGQSGVKKVYSDFLQENLKVPVENITFDAGASNSEILRRITEYAWTNNVEKTGFVVQWSTIERLEFCDEKNWYSSKRSYDDNQLVQMMLDKINETQAYTYSESTYFWQFIQQVMALHSLMKQKNSHYFQVYCIGSVLNDFFFNVKETYFSKYGREIYKNFNQTKWLMNDVLKADLSNKGYPVISSDDLHFNLQGHKMIAREMAQQIKKEKWL